MLSKIDRAEHISLSGVKFVRNSEIQNPFYANILKVSWGVILAIPTFQQSK